MPPFAPECPLFFTRKLTKHPLHIHPSIHYTFIRPSIHCTSIHPLLTRTLLPLFFSALDRRRLPRLNRKKTAPSAGTCPLSASQSQQSRGVECVGGVFTLGLFDTGFSPPLWQLHTILSFVAPIRYYLNSSAPLFFHPPPHRLSDPSLLGFSDPHLRQQRVPPSGLVSIFWMLSFWLGVAFIYSHPALYYILLLSQNYPAAEVLQRLYRR